jgi:hypothetical protein
MQHLYQNSSTIRRRPGQRDEHRHIVSRFYSICNYRLCGLSLVEGKSNRLIFFFLNLSLQFFMTAIAEGRRLSLLALAKPDFFFLFKLYFYAFKRHSFYTFMRAITKRSFGSKTTTAPGVNFARLYSDACRLMVCNMR